MPSFNVITETLDQFAPRSLVRMLSKRSKEFESSEQMMLTAIGLDQQARIDLELHRDKQWATQDKKSVVEAYNEVILGGGLHAASYAAVRMLLGYPRPLIIEARRVGGEFAVSVHPSFTMNSRNRPGMRLGDPSENAALNVIPGAPVQAMNLSNAEFQTNADLAFVIRSAIMKYADVRYGTVTSIRGGDALARYRVETESGEAFEAGRVIDARGLGKPNELYNYNGIVMSENALGFRDFMAMMDSPFPLQGMRRVAVVGAGDSARCAVEALLGIGPNRYMNIPMLDWIEQIDWYAPNLSDNCEDWKSEERTRYAALGAALRRLDNGLQRVRIFNVRGAAQDTYEGVLVNGRSYDTVINATGFQRVTLGGYGDDYFEEYGSRPVLARQSDRGGIYRIGVTAELPFDGADSDATTRVRNNQVAIFRLARRTAALASQLRTA